MNVSGKLRKQLIVDLSVAFGLGITGGYAFWFGYHIPAVRKRDAYYAKLEAEGTGKGLITRNLYSFPESDGVGTCNDNVVR